MSDSQFVVVHTDSSVYYVGDCPTTSFEHELNNPPEGYELFQILDNGQGFKYSKAYLLVFKKKAST